MQITDKLTAAYIKVNTRAQAVLADERGDGPTDNSILIGVGATAAITLTGLVVAAVAKHAGNL